MSTQPVDLNALRQTILENQKSQDSLPEPSDGKVYADSNGQIVMGKDAQPGQQRQLSEIHQATFAFSVS